MYNGTELNPSGGIDQARFYADQNALKSLVRSSESEAAGLKQAAEEFESLFINMMFQSMRKANTAFSEGSLFNSQETKFFREMLDNQMSVEMAQKGGIGLADMLVRQLSSLTQEGEKDDKAAAGDAQGAAGGAQATALTGHRMEAMRLNTPATQQDTTEKSLPTAALGQMLYGDAHSVSAYNARETGQAAPKVTHPSVTNSDATYPNAAHQQSARHTSPLDRLRDPALYADPVNAPNEKDHFDAPEEFVAAMWPHAQDAAQRLGVDPRVLVAQAALETGWGKHIMGNGAGGSSKNLFGIKATRDQAGAVAHNTTEFRAGTARTERAHFRTYDSFAQSFGDYVNLLSQSSRYDTARAQAHDPKAFMQALQSAGYATDPKYADKIYRIFQGIDEKLAAAGLASESMVAMRQL